MANVGAAFHDNLVQLSVSRQLPTVPTSPSKPSQAMVSFQYPVVTMRRRMVIFGVACVAVQPAFALYDPKPEAALSAVQGEWSGSLTYRDYSEPKRLVTLPTRLFIALSAPNELVLHYAFDDGPSKTVYSYEKMRFDFVGRQVAWSSGDEENVSVCAITADSTNDAIRALVFERNDANGIKRFSLALSARALSLAEDEVGTSGVASFRNKYVFSRPAT